MSPADRATAAACLGVFLLVLAGLLVGLLSGVQRLNNTLRQIERDRLKDQEDHNSSEDKQ